MLYELARPLLFALDAETAHDWTLRALDRAAGVGLTPGACVPDDPIDVWGLRFSNRVGLAAGLDKNGDHIDALAALGFGFLEIGTVTPRPQPGNPKPRLFRLPQAEALINRLGFNNFGVEHLVKNVEGKRYRGVLGINIGKNFDTPMERAADDYLHCMRRVFALASYITINISSPNTKNLRALQEGDELARLLEALKSEQSKLATQHGKRTPLLLKIAPDLEPDQISAIADLLLRYNVEGLIATNTTVSRDGVSGLRHGGESGGLSGAPVREKSTAVLRAFAQALAGRIPIIGVGGILSAQHAQEKIQAGASLVQVYTGLIYRGPGLVGEIVRGCRRSRHTP